MQELRCSMHSGSIQRLGLKGRHQRVRASAASSVIEPGEASTSGQLPLPAPTPLSPGILSAGLPPLKPWIRPQQQRLTPRSVSDSGTLRPSPEWFPAWMKYRRREDNNVFWQDKFNRNSTDIPDVEKRWTVFSTIWYLFGEWKYNGTPPALRFLWYLAWRGIMQRVYEAHKAFVLWQCTLEAALASRATGGQVQTFSRTMALRRLHWRNNLLGEALYLVNVYKTGRVHLLPPMRGPPQRPTFFWLF